MGTGVRDRITLTGITAVGHHGVFEHERRDGQPFTVDVVLHLDLRAAADSDNLANTADYADVADRVLGVITGAPYNLIETVAERIARSILGSCDAAAVEVTVHKPQAPLAVAFADVAVTIFRERT